MRAKIYQTENVLFYPALLMIRTSFFIAILCATFALSIGAVFAQTQGSGFLGLSLGRYNTFSAKQHELDFRLEYRPNKPVFLNVLKPWLGLGATSKASIWAGGGFLADFKLADNIVLTPSFGLGFYAKGSSNTDLDYPLQFRSQLEISYVFQDNRRLGLALSHMSNGGLGNHNPGAEVFGLYYFWPY